MIYQQLLSSDDLSTTAKLFAADTSLFSIVQNANTSASRLNNDLSKISNWAFQWKVRLNPDPSPGGSFLS